MSPVPAPMRAELLETMLTVEDVAELCHTTPGTVHYWRTMGKGPTGTKVGRRILFRQSDVADWLGRHRETPPLDAA